MNKTLAIGLGLAAAATAALAAGVYYWQTSALVPERVEGRVLPALEKRIEDVGAVVIRRGADEFTIKRQAAGGWTLPGRGDYPAKAEAVGTLLRQLATLDKAEPKTSKPENYSKLGVQDPGPPIDPGAVNPGGPTLVTLKDEKDQPISTVIVGDQRPGSITETYVRLPGEAQTWLVKGTLELPKTQMGYADAQIVNLDKLRWSRAVVAHPDGETLTAEKENPAFTVLAVRDVPAGRELRAPSAADTLTQALSWLNLDDVSPLDKIDFEGKSGGAPGPVTQFRDADGFMVTVQQTKQNEKNWVRLVASYDEPAPTPAPVAPDAAAVPTGATGATSSGDGGTGAPDAPAGAGGATASPSTPASAATPAPTAAPPAAAAPTGKKPRSADDLRKEVKDFNDRHGRWAYAIPEYKAKALGTRMEDLLKPPAKPAVGATGATGQPVPMMPTEPPAGMPLPGGG